MADSLEPENDYYDRVHRNTWLRRTAGLMTGATMGAGYGILIGAAAVAIPAVLATIGIAGVTAAAAAGPGAWPGSLHRAPAQSAGRAAVPAS